LPRDRRKRTCLRVTYETTSVFSCSSGQRQYHEERTLLKDIPDAPAKSQISFGKFQNLDMRVARVIAAPLAEGTRSPSRILTLDLGHLGQRVSVGQYALIPEAELVGKHVVACINLGPREIGPYISDALVLGALNPLSPTDQAQAVPITIDNSVVPGSAIF
jgi:tRNA-binding protein